MHPLSGDASIYNYANAKGQRISIRHQPSHPLAEESRVPSDEVYLKKIPDGFLVVTRDPWEIFFEGVAELSDGFMAGKRRQPKAERRKRKT